MVPWLSFIKPAAWKRTKRKHKMRWHEKNMKRLREYQVIRSVTHGITKWSPKRSWRWLCNLPSPRSHFWFAPIRSVCSSFLFDPSLSFQRIHPTIHAIFPDALLLTCRGQPVLGFQTMFAIDSTPDASLRLDDSRFFLEIFIITIMYFLYVKQCIYHRVWIITNHNDGPLLKTWKKNLLFDFFFQVFNSFNFKNKNYMRTLTVQFQIKTTSTNQKQSATKQLSYYYFKDW